MRIAIVLNSSWNIYNFRLGLLRALRESGYDMMVIAPEDAYSHKLKELGFEFCPVKMDSKGVNPLKDSSVIWQLYKIYKAAAPDIILHYTVKPNIYGTLAANLLGIPSINNVCGLGTVFLKKGLVSSVAKMLYKIAFQYPKKVFFQNEDDYDLFLKEGLVRKEIADNVPGSGINLQNFIPQPKYRTGKFTFLVISRLIYDKGIMEYIEAINMLRAQGVDARFQLLGAKEAAHTRGIHPILVDDWVDQGIVEYLGTTDDVRPFINQADCVVLPSYREGLPRTLLEAASLAKPIVTTDVPGCRDVVTDGENGFLCQVRNAKDLAEKMRWMYSLTPKELERMGAMGRQRVESCFDEKLVIQKYRQAIEEVMMASISSATLVELLEMKSLKPAAGNQ